MKLKELLNPEEVFKLRVKYGVTHLEYIDHIKHDMGCCQHDEDVMWCETYDTLESLFEKGSHVYLYNSDNGEIRGFVKKTRKPITTFPDFIYNHDEAYAFVKDEEGKESIKPIKITPGSIVKNVSYDGAFFYFWLEGDSEERLFRTYYDWSLISHTPENVVQLNLYSSYQNTIKLLKKTTKGMMEQMKIKKP